MAYHLNIIFPLVIPLVQTNTVYFNDYTKNSNNDFNTTFSNIKFQVYDTILSYIRIVILHINYYLTVQITLVM